MLCASCGAQIADNAAFCPACGNAVGRTSSGAAAIPARRNTGGLSDTLAGALAYFTIIPAIVFLLIEPYNRRRFVRYHAFQSIFFAVACMVISFALRIVGFMPVLRWSTLVLWPLLWLAELVVWLICVLKAYQGRMFKLPVIGNLAEQQAFTMPDDNGQAKALNGQELRLRVQLERFRGRYTEKKPGIQPGGDSSGYTNKANSSSGFWAGSMPPVACRRPPASWGGCRTGSGDRRRSA